MTTTSIEWTDRTWNPVTGCTKVSAGCKHCYAEVFARRTWGKRRFTDVRQHPERLSQPLRWKPQRVFVNSMSDLFHDAVPIEFIAQVFDVMACATTECGKRHKHEEECWTGPPHTYQILTKRPERMRQVLERELLDFADNLMPGDSPLNVMREVGEWPLPNVWLGVSCEDQRAADERIPLLLRTPAAVRFLSCEPLLGPIDLAHVVEADGWGDQCGEWDRKAWDCMECGGTGWYEPAGPQTRPCRCRVAGHAGVGVDWVIVGGESGPGARPFHAAWARSLVDQCRVAGVARFVKQLGRFPAVDPVPDGDVAHASCLQADGVSCAAHRRDGRTSFMSFGSAAGWKDVDALPAGVLMHRRLRHPKGGDPAEWPEDLRVREFPR